MAGHHDHLRICRFFFFSSRLGSVAWMEDNLNRPGPRITPGRHLADIVGTGGERGYGVRSGFLRKRTSWRVTRDVHPCDTGRRTASHTGPGAAQARCTKPGTMHQARHDVLDGAKLGCPSSSMLSPPWPCCPGGGVKGRRGLGRPRARRTPVRV